MTIWKKKVRSPIYSLIGSYLCTALWAYAAVHFALQSNAYWPLFAAAMLVFLGCAWSETKRYRRYKAAKAEYERRRREKSSGQPQENE